MTEASVTTLTANGLSHRVLQWGGGPADVVLCHGFLDVAWSFDALAKRLVESGHRVASFDWRGHGKSEWIGNGGYYHFPDYVLDLDELLPQLAEGPVHLVGHSMGGTACSMYAAARPKNIRTLTLIEGLGPPELEPMDPAQRLGAWLDGVAKVRAKTPRTVPNVEAALKRMRIQNPELDDALGTFLIEKSTVAVDGGLQWSFDPLHRTWSPRPFSAELFGRLLAAIEAPTLVVSGGNGYRLADEDDRIARLPHPEHVEIPEVGHMIHWFAADALAYALAAFFARHAA